MAWALHPVGVPGYEPECYVSLTAMNKGRRPVTLSAAGLTLSNRMDCVYTAKRGEFPRQLNEGEQHCVLMKEDSLKEAFGRYAAKVDIEFAWFRDQTDRLYKTRLPKNMKGRLLG